MATADLGVRAWAKRQFAGADLGDKRRTRRLANVAADIANKPVGIPARRDRRPLTRGRN